MDNIINETKNGKVFICKSCKKIHVEFNNLNFNFTKEEFYHFSRYISQVNGEYWEKVNTDSTYRRKILIPLDHKNLNLLLNKEELEEMKILLKSAPLKQKQMKLLAYSMINFQTFYN
ncbi:MAG: hypothetical protein JEZ09_08830 [Salinivirgaceae bacterium]|nr:hypothetical protein [Salinivirgaceae bacterium]